jgi:hypothetical protein
MATYIPGVKSYMPKYTPFTPDYKFLSDVLDVRTNKYNTNYKQLNDLYSKVVYAPLSRQDTQSMRDQYTEGLSDKLEKISGMDLSLMQNVDAAKAVFRPFFEEDIIVKDMVTTKTYENEMAYANRLLNSPDEERNKLYWDTGVQAMNYKMEDFINAAPDQALNMSLPKYVPNANLYELSLKALEESGISVSQDVISPDGQWVIRQENGSLVTAPALEYVQRTLLNNPNVVRAYQTQSFVDSRNYAQKGIDNGTFASVEEGQRAWAMGEISKMQELAAEKTIEQKEELRNLEHSNASWDAFREEYGIIPGSEQDKQMQEQYGKYAALKEDLNRSTNIVAKASSPMDGQSTQELLNRAYNLTMEYNIKDDMIAAARMYGEMSASTKIVQENPEFARQQKYKYAVALEDYKQINRQNLEILKASLEKEKEAVESPFGDGELTVTFGEDGTTGERFEKTESGYYDMLKYQAGELVKIDQEITGEKISTIIEATKYFQKDNQASNEFDITLNGQLVTKSLGKADGSTPNTIGEMLNMRDPETGEYIYKEDINRLYEDYEKQMGNLSQSNPDIVYDDQSYNRLNLGFSKVKSDETRANDNLNKYNQSLVDNYNLVKESGLYDDYEIVEGFKQNGLDFEIIEQTESGARIIPKEEFVTRYVEGAKQGKYKANLGWWSRNTGLGPQSILDNENYTYTRPYTREEMDALYGFDRNNEYAQQVLKEQRFLPRQGTFFSVTEAQKDASKMYDHMYTMLNNTQNGMYSGEAEQIKKLQKENKSIGDVKPDLTTPGAQVGFKVYDPAIAWQGRPQPGTVSDLISSATYSYTVDPFVINQDPTAINLIKDVITQINITPKASMTIQPGNIASQKNPNYSAANDLFAQTLIENYIRDIQSISKNPDQSKTNPPLATVYYSPNYGKDKASYRIKFDPAWLNAQKSLYTGDDQPVTGAQLDNYQTITFAFDQDMDISPRRSGQYNYSEVLSEINNSYNQQYTYNYENGGKISIIQDTDGSYMARVTLEHYNPTLLERQTLPTQTYNLNEVIYNQTGTTDIMSYIDPITNNFKKILYDQAITNNNLLKQTSANNNAVK